MRAWLTSYKQTYLHTAYASHTYADAYNNYRRTLENYFKRLFFQSFKRKYWQVNKQITLIYQIINWCNWCDFVPDNTESKIQLLIAFDEGQQATVSIYCNKKCHVTCVHAFIYMCTK